MANTMQSSKESLCISSQKKVVVVTCQYDVNEVPEVFYRSCCTPPTFTLAHHIFIYGYYQYLVLMRQVRVVTNAHLCDFPP